MRLEALRQELVGAARRAAPARAGGLDRRQHQRPRSGDRPGRDQAVGRPLRGPDRRLDGRPRSRRSRRRGEPQAVLRYREPSLHLPPPARRQRRRPHPFALRHGLRGCRPADPRLPHGPGRRVRGRDPVRRLRVHRRRLDRRAGGRGHRPLAGDPAARTTACSRSAPRPKPRSRPRSWSRTSPPRPGPRSRSAPRTSSTTTPSRVSIVATPPTTASSGPTPAKEFDVLDLSASEVWFVTGSQHLYGPETLETVARDSAEIAAALDAAEAIPTRVVVKPVLTGSDGIRALVMAANADPNCVGVITWMHTFSPAKMWIAGLSALQRPLLHLHTQYNREIPWDAIDMDFMNLHQAAHGDREFGFIAARMRLERKVVVGHWGDRRGPGPDRRVDARGLRPARLGAPPDRPVRREHARGRGHGRRQGRGPATARVQRQRLWRGRPGRGRRRCDRRRRRRPDRHVPRRVRRGRGAASRRRPRRRRCATARGSSSASGASSRTAGSAPSRPPSRTCTA